MILDLDQHAREEQDYRSWPNQAHAYLHRAMRGRLDQAQRAEDEIAHLRQRIDQCQREADESRLTAEQMREALSAAGFVFP